MRVGSGEGGALDGAALPHHPDGAEAVGRGPKHTFQNIETCRLLLSLLLGSAGCLPVSSGCDYKEN